MKTPTMLLRRVHFLIPLLVITLMVSSCNKETICSQDIPIIKQSNDQESDAMIYGPIVLGKQLENPYSIANMQKAYDMLSATKANFVRTDLQTTHFYVKFAPKDEFELNELKRDTTLFFYEYPLDYEVVVYGSYYHDPSLPEDVPTYQYVSVPADKWQILSKSSIEYEVLEELFIPDEYGDNFEVIKTKALGILTEDQIEELVSKSFEITGNSITPRTKASESWTPAGRIYYVDDATGGRVVGLEGITVKAKRWFTTHSGVTDASGYYVCDGSFKNPADYSFDLECYDFEIRGGNGVQTSFGQNNVTGNYNKCFSRSLSVLDLYVATAYRAAYYYYYKPIGGLHRPPMNGFWNTKLRIKVFNETNPSESGDL